MGFRSFLLLSLACLVYKNEASDILKALPQAELILQKFLNLVDTNQLNVSILTSHAKHWSNGEVQQMVNSTLLLPPNNVVLTESQLTPEVGEQWLSDLASWTSQGSGLASYRVLKFRDGKLTKKSKSSSNVEWVQRLQTYDNVLVKESEDCEVMYNYDFQDADNDNVNIKVFAVNLDVKIDEYSEHISSAQLDQMKQILSKIWMMTNGDTDLTSQYLADSFNEHIPLRYTNWEVLIDPEYFYIPNARWVKLTIFNTDFVVYALDL